MIDQSLVVIGSPASQNKWLRFKAGEWFERPSIFPQYGGELDRTFLGMRSHPDLPVKIFRVLGYGETAEGACDMAARTLERRKTSNKTLTLRAI